MKTPKSKNIFTILNEEKKTKKNTKRDRANITTLTHR